MLFIQESGCLGLQPYMGDKLLLKSHIHWKPIANKYCEGQVKRTLTRGLKDLKSLRRKQYKWIYVSYEATQVRNQLVVVMYVIG